MWFACRFFFAASYLQVRGHEPTRNREDAVGPVRAMTRGLTPFFNRLVSSSRAVRRSRVPHVLRDMMRDRTQPYFSFVGGTAVRIVTPLDNASSGATLPDRACVNRKLFAASIFYVR